MPIQIPKEALDDDALELRELSKHFNSPSVHHTNISSTMLISARLDRIRQRLKANVHFKLAHQRPCDPTRVVAPQGRLASPRAARTRIPSRALLTLEAAPASGRGSLPAEPHAQPLAPLPLAPSSLSLRARPCALAGRAKALKGQKIRVLTGELRSKRAGETIVTTNALLELVRPKKEQAGGKKKKKDGDSDWGALGALFES